MIVIMSGINTKIVHLKEDGGLHISSTDDFGTKTMENQNRIKILNTWISSKNDLNFIQVSDPILENEDFSVFKQSEKIYLYAYKNIGINQLAGLNKEYFIYLVKR